MSNFSIGAVIVCDDVRKEITNKDILIGVYGSGITVPSFPVTIPLAVWMEFIPDEVSHYEMDFRVTLPQAGGVFQMRFIVEAKIAGEILPAFTPSLMCTILEAGEITFEVKSAQEGNWRLLKSKHIAAGEAPIVRPPQLYVGPAPAVPTEETISPPSSQPSEHSPPDAPETKSASARRPRSSRRTARTSAPE